MSVRRFSLEGGAQFMKRIGIVLALLMFCSFALWAQNSSSSNDSNMGNAAQSTSTTQTTTTTTTSNQDNNQQPSSDNSSMKNSNSDMNGQNASENNAQQTTEPARTNSDQTTNERRKQQAINDDNAASAEKDRAKNASGADSERDKAIARLDSAAADLNQLLAAKDNGIPDSVFTKAKCIAVIPDMIKGGFIFGAEHGRGVATCRQENGTWSAPAFFVMTGGNWGAQIGVEGVDLVMLVMNENGMNQLLSSKWKLGGSASAAAGPIGRQAAADTNLKFNTEILTYSRARGAYAGATLNGANIKTDEGAMRAYYHNDASFRSVLTGQVHDPLGHADKFLSSLRQNRAEVNATAH